MENLKKDMVKRGHIYKWHEGFSDERFVLVISDDSRGNERFINVLMFGNSPAGRDAVEIRNSLLEDKRYLHCGMVTYVYRDDMSELPLAQISEKKLAQIDKLLCISLGITNEKVLTELNFYKRKCDDLIEKLTGINIDL